MDTNNNIHFGRSSDPGQIYINGLTIHITRDDLMEYFSQFGAVVESVFVNAIENYNKVFNFGFVTFADPSVADLLMEGRRMHRINGETVRIHKPFQTWHADSQVNRGEENLSNDHHDMRSEEDVESSVQQDRLAYGRQGSFNDGQSSHGINDSNGVNSNNAAGTSPKSPRYQFQENTSTGGKRDHRQYHHHHHRRQHHNHHHRHDHYHHHCHHHHFYSHIEMDKESVTSPSSKS